MFLNVLANENMKLFKRRLFWAEIIFLGLIVFGILLALFITVETNRNGSGLLSDERQMMLETLSWPQAWSNVIRFVGWDGFGPIFLMILVGAVTAQEYTWRTQQLSLSRGISRRMLLMAKLAALFIAGLLFILTILVVGGGATAIFSLLLNGSLQLPYLDLSHLLFSILRAAYTMLPYGCLVFFLAVASRSAVVATGGGLVISLMLENMIISGAGLLGDKASQIVQYLPGGLSNSLLALNNASLGTGSSSDMSLVSPLHASIGLAAWIVLFIGLSLWFFQRQDLVE
jgi:ABC-type transport system involved in multi-copper enzyme maturation permease subunit